MTASQMSSRPSNSFSSKRAGIKMTELGCVQRCSTHCTKKKEPNDFVNVSSPLLLQETLVYSFKMKESLSAHGPLGMSCCWQSFCFAAAKLAFQDEMVNMAAFCHREGDGGVFYVVSRHHLLVVRKGSSRSARTQR